MDYSQFEIFRDITDREVEAMIRCFHMRQDAFQPGETICTYGDGGQEVGVVVEGAAELVRFDLAGARTILERLEEGSVFGEALAFTAQLGDCVEVVCARPCRVLFMEYAHIMKRCEKACLHHSKLVHNMFRLVSQQTQASAAGWRFSPAAASGTNSSATSRSAAWRPARTASPCPLPSAPWPTTSAPTAAP